MIPQCFLWSQSHPYSPWPHSMEHWCFWTSKITALTVMAHCHLLYTKCRIFWSPFPSSHSSPRDEIWSSSVGSARLRGVRVYYQKRHEILSNRLKLSCSLRRCMCSSSSSLKLYIQILRYQFSFTTLHPSIVGRFSAHLEVQPWLRRKIFGTTNYAFKVVSTPQEKVCFCKSASRQYLP